MNQQVANLMEKHYELAYNIAKSFHAPLIPDDIKEGIALQALQRAAESYNPSKNTKFSTFLHLCVVNSLKSEAVRVKKMPSLISEVNNTEGQTSSVFDFVDSRVSYNEGSDNFDKILSHLDATLTPRQRKLLEMLMNPEVEVAKYAEQAGLKKTPKKLTWAIMTKALGVSQAYVSIELKKIREVARKVLEQKV